MKDGEIIWQGLPEDIRYSDNDEIKLFLRRLEFSLK
jgi:phospholipid/cholesterol/gamma-HCH transport system ATP-binding protein